MAKSLSLAYCVVIFFGCVAGSAQAQQTTAGDTTEAQSGSTLLTITGSGKKNFVPLWTGTSTLGSSKLFQTKSGDFGIGTKTPQQALDVVGNIQASGNYAIGGSPVLSTNPSQGDLFVGFNSGNQNAGVSNNFFGTYAGSNNTSGKDNTFVGDQAGFGNSSGEQDVYVGHMAGYTISSGLHNTFVGDSAGVNSLGGNENTFLGFSAGYSTSTTGDNNTFVGSQVGANNTTGTGNTFSGFKSGYVNTDGSGNVFSGQFTGFANSTGNYNTVVGYAAGESSTTGNNNTFLGQGAGINNSTGSYNLYISSFGTPDGSQESNTIRIGDPSNQTSAYMAGIYGVTFFGGYQPVYASFKGQLGQPASSRRFKEQIRDMGDITNGLMKLRPVTFLYKSEYAKGPRTRQYGLIAEEVAEVYPDLVAYAPNGEPLTVSYHLLTTMLLNEFQKQYHRAEVQQEKIQGQQQQIEELQSRLSRMEALIGGRVLAAEGGQSGKPAPESLKLR